MVRRRPSVRVRPSAPEFDFQTKRRLFDGTRGARGGSGCFCIFFYKTGVYLRFRSNLFYQKFLKKSNCSVPPLLANARHPAKNFFSHFLIWRAIYFSSKRKKTFLWCFALNEQAAGLASFFCLGVV